MLRILKWGLGIGILTVIAANLVILMATGHLPHPEPAAAVQAKESLDAWAYGERRRATNYIISNSKDPDSVKFDFVLVVDPGPGWKPDQVGVVCGRFNAKNSFGAYAGWRGFVQIQENKKVNFGTVLIERYNGGEFERAWARHCLGAKFL